ncbi:MAG: transcriptional regulator PpsR [Proteobacteria bacterium]|nr:transcriptional regulator PpsR [Burkholderiales bacterium]
MDVAAVRQFRSPKRSLGELDAEATATLLAVATDIALVVDAGGVIRDLAVGSEELELDGYADWIGQPWTSTVTVESRSKVEELLKDAAEKVPARWRHVNHPSARGEDLPMLYSAVQVGNKGRVIAVGRNLRSIALLQQKLLDVQQSMERDYLRLRHAETRYRLLFQMAAEAVLIIDAATQRVVDANPAAAQLLEESARRLVGRPFPEGFDAPSTLSLQSLLAAVRAAGSADEVRARLVEGRREFLVGASMFRQDNASLFLVRLSPLSLEASAAALPRVQSRLADVVESLPDGFMVTDTDGLILTANRAFLELIQLTTEEQARGQSIDRWLGRPGVDLNVLLANLRQHGSVRLFATTLRGEYGTTTEVEISAVSAPQTDPPCLGFTLRNTTRRPAAEVRSTHVLPRSVEQLTELVGRVSLKELVRETTDVIERLCIEAALELTGDNRASAAEMLGLSRQSLYVKLRRYGLGDLAPEA